MSGRNAFAAPCAAAGDNLAAALCCDTGTVTVPALADKLGWLIGALHLFVTAECGPSSVCFSTGAFLVRLLICAALAGKKLQLARAFKSSHPQSQSQRFHASQSID
jgi:hypothetical protein